MIENIKEKEKNIMNNFSNALMLEFLETRKDREYIRDMIKINIIFPTIVIFLIKGS